MTLKEEILAKLEKLDNVPNVNYGGCAIAAYALVEWLKSKGIHAHVVYLFEGYDEEARDNLEYGIKPDSCGHAVVALDNVYYDSRGVYTMGDGRYELALTLEQDTVMHSIKYAASWNLAFNRETGVPAINRILDTAIEA